MRLCPLWGTLLIPVRAFSLALASFRLSRLAKVDKKADLEKAQKGLGRRVIGVAVDVHLFMFSGPFGCALRGQLLVIFRDSCTIKVKPLARLQRAAKIRY